ncbi:MAG: anion permease [Chitinophagales bacterium]
MSSIGILALVVLLGLIFDYVNGFHDTANAIATSVSTKALSPRTAVLMAAVLNFIGALSGTAVAKKIGSGIVNPDVVSVSVLSAALIGAIAWNIITWYFGIPSSSSHALIGGLMGAAISAYGLESVNWRSFLEILAVLIISPAVGMLVGSFFMTVFYWIFGRFSPARINNVFRRLQMLSAGMMSFAHGSNDAQKSMGIITLALLTAHVIPEFSVPMWVIVLCATSMAMGTLLGGWKIIKTMGGKIFRIEPINGFASDFSSSLVIYSASFLGMPVSTTHVVSSAIMGVGAVKRLKGVRWGIAQQIVTAWLITIPSAALITAIFFNLGRLLIRFF